MKVTHIDLYSNNSLVTTFSFREPDEHVPYIVTAISGLDTDEIIASNSGEASDGTSTYSLRNVEREINVKATLNPDFLSGQTYSSLRDTLYKAAYSNRKAEVTLKFKYGSVIVATVSGVVKRIDAPLFSKTQQILLVMNCRDSILRAPDELTVASPMSGTTMTIVDDISTKAHGFTFNMTINEDARRLVIVHQGAEMVIGSTDVDDFFLIGDILYFSSVENDKQLYLERGSANRYLGDVIQKGSIWPIVFPLTNTYEFTLENDTPSDFTMNEVKHRPAFWGV